MLENLIQWLWLASPWILGAVLTTYLWVVLCESLENRRQK